MESIIFIALPLLLLALAVLGAAAFFEVAFGSFTGSLPAGPTHGDVPLLSGVALQQWARRKARQVVAKYDQDNRGGGTAIELAHEIEDLTSRVMRTSIPWANRAISAQCERARPGTISISAPEALAIADTLRHRLSRSELHKLRSRAETNVNRLTPGSQSVAPRGSVECPLISKDGCCLGYESRPVFCRANCPSCIQIDSALPASSEQSDMEFSAIVGQGISEGLAEGLTAAGLDSQLYELNSALVGALDSPEAVRRWARGEVLLDS